MQINRLNQQISFGKQAVMTCKVKNNETKKRADATLYKMDPQKRDDVNEVRYSKTARAIAYDMTSDSYTGDNFKQYYILKDDNTDEVIACLQTSRHYRPTSDFDAGFAVVVEELEDNKKYVSAKEPLFAYAAHLGNLTSSQTVISAYDENIVPNLRKAQFKRNELGDLILPQKKFDAVINQAQDRHNIQFLG